jgi:dolichol-phosphate mannosyltransferase
LIQIIWFDLVIKASYIIILLLLLLFGIQFILIGIVGRYVALVNDETKNRPTYIIKTKLGFKE